MKLALLLAFYVCDEGNIQEIKRLISSIPNDTIDYIIAVDGIFHYWHEQDPELDLLSPSYARELLTECDKFKTLLYDLPNTNEFRKRNKYLEICKDLNVDVGIIVDLDEYFIYPDNQDKKVTWINFIRNIEQAIEEHPGHNVFSMPALDLHQTGMFQQGVTERPRVWVDPGSMSYFHGSHYYYGNQKTELARMEYYKSFSGCYQQPRAKLIEGLTLGHDHSLRSKWYEKIRVRYVKYLLRYEELIQSHKYTADEAHVIARR